MNTNVIAHVDKIEIYFPKNAHNAAILSTRFHDLTRAYTDRLEALQWIDHAKILDQEGNWKDWQIVGTNDHVKIAIRGRAYHITETDRKTRLFGEPHWLDVPFPNAIQCTEIYPHHVHLGRVKITDPAKDAPINYNAHLSVVLHELEAFGIETFPKQIEIALDCTDHDLAVDLIQTTRLKWANAVDLVHFRPGLQGRPFSGPSPDGDREYQAFRSFPQEGTRLLVCYPRWPEHGYHRTELRLGPRSLRRFYRSKAFLKELSHGEARHLQTASPTAQILAMMPTLLRRNLMRERLDLDTLYREYPRATLLGLEGLSIRGQYYRLLSVGFSTHQIRRYTLRLDFPPMTILTPTNAGAFKGVAFKGDTNSWKHLETLTKLKERS